MFSILFSSFSYRKPMLINRTASTIIRATLSDWLLSLLREDSPVSLVSGIYVTSGCFWILPPPLPSEFFSSRAAAKYILDAKHQIENRFFASECRVKVTTLSFQGTERSLPSLTLSTEFSDIFSHRRGKKKMY